MKTLYLLDRLIPKHITVEVPDSFGEIPVGEKIVYKLPDDHKSYLGQNVGYPLKADKKGTFVSVLAGREYERFVGYQEKSQQYYDLFKKQFPEVCPGAIPVTTRADLQ